MSCPAAPAPFPASPFWPCDWCDDPEFCTHAARCPIDEAPIDSIEVRARPNLVLVAPSTLGRPIDDRGAHQAHGAHAPGPRAAGPIAPACRKERYLSPRSLILGMLPGLGWVAFGFVWGVALGLEWVT